MNPPSFVAKDFPGKSKIFPATERSSVVLVPADRAGSGWDHTATVKHTIKRLASDRIVRNFMVPPGWIKATATYRASYYFGAGWGLERRKINAEGTEEARRGDS